MDSPAHTPIPSPSMDVKEMLNKIPPPFGRRGSGLSLSASRLDTCNRCEFKKDQFCDVCGCVIALKARVPFAHCPMGRW